MPIWTDTIPGTRTELTGIPFLMELALDIIGNRHNK